MTYKPQAEISVFAEDLAAIQSSLADLGLSAHSLDVGLRCALHEGVAALQAAVAGGDDINDLEAAAAGAGLTHVGGGGTHFVALEAADLAAVRTVCVTAGPGATQYNNFKALSAHAIRLGRASFVAGVAGLTPPVTAQDIQDHFV